MIVYDGKYAWKGKSSRKKRPISWWHSAYRLRIVDLSGDANNVVFLKPIIVSFSDTGEGASVANCLPDLAKQICEDFDLDIDRVMWVEDRPESTERFRIALFQPVARVGAEFFYHVVWRAALPSELGLIETHCE